MNDLQKSLYLSPSHFHSQHTLLHSLCPPPLPHHLTQSRHLLYLLRQLPMYLIEYLRIRGGQCEQRVIVEKVREVREHLAKRVQRGGLDNSGSQKQQDVEKVVVGMLHGMRCFQKLPKTSTWMLVADAADEWIGKELNKIRDMHILYPETIQESQVALDPADFIRENVMVETNLTLPLPEEVKIEPQYQQQVVRNNEDSEILGKRQERDILSAFESMHQATQCTPLNILKVDYISTLTPDTAKIANLLIKHGSDKAMGMALAFKLLSPTVQKILETRERQLVMASKVEKRAEKKAQRKLKESVRAIEKQVNDLDRKNQQQ
ncbi:hypothetical protein FGO68_gene9673 [Halteria grandinella]|uniref:Uncharacterized protein n=1 Tax=Halteria grandinella TaxID=5974 RepID=A0A8J8NC58_HALGN|nr:hypothetical protein FGO68_gene9673 [Halteria grandinella]